MKRMLTALAAVAGMTLIGGCAYDDYGYSGAYGAYGSYGGAYGSYGGAYGYSGAYGGHPAHRAKRQRQDHDYLCLPASSRPHRRRRPAYCHH